MAAIQKQSSDCNPESSINRECANSNENQNGPLTTKQKVQKAAGYTPELQTVLPLDIIVREKVFSEAASKRLKEKAHRANVESHQAKDIFEQLRLRLMEMDLKKSASRFQKQSHQMTNALRVRKHF